MSPEVYICYVMMNRETRVRAELRDRVAFAQRTKQAGPPCSTCRHKTLLGACGNAAYARQTFEPHADRYSETFDVEVAAARADDGLCGPEGLLWEEMPPLQMVVREVKSFAEMHPWTAYAVVVGTWVLITLWR
jgi:hypothetical protein